jgi:pyrimidine operon attenuation protein/uracil phosphoribosyltransferase
VPTGALDITLYRDDLMRNPVGPQPVIRRTEIPFSIDDRKILLVDDVLYTGRTIRARARRADRLRPAARDSAGRARRPRPSRAADQGRLRRQEPADLAQGERAGPAAGRSTAIDEVVHRGPRS